MDYHRAVNFCITGFIYGESIGSVVVFADRKTFVNSHFASLTFYSEFSMSSLYSARAVNLESAVINVDATFFIDAEFTVCSIHSAITIEVCFFYRRIVSAVSIFLMGNVLCLSFQIIYIALYSRQLTFCCGTIFVYRCSIVPSRIRKTCNFI